MPAPTTRKSASVTMIPRWTWESAPALACRGRRRKPLGGAPARRLTRWGAGPRVRAAFEEGRMTDARATTDPAERQRALAARAWPFEEARRLLERFKDAPPEKGYVLFETGYGPSGLP